ncbi:restriction endonuclease subunit S [Janibacter hoylei]|uniref:restriction endonuclease subunit S n=1 Tax=Janibacter hoylei TaxID=364298 RepID=UPI002238A252|nr:restriction endonuclease subunit S [Janibacter hoylei]MCW4601565.1 restriction endonuclease subunit S [Janibacter hoylei]
MRAVALGDACDVITDGTHYTPTDVGSGVPFLTVKDLSDRGLDFDGCAHITESDFLDADAGRSAPRAGDVLFSKDGTVGKVHVVEEGRRFAVLSSLAILRPSEHVDSKFMGRMLATPHVLDQASKRKSGSAIRRIILSDLRKVMIPLPSLSEQRRIAALLDHADALRAKRRRILAHLDDLTQSTFVDMFGHPVTGSRCPRAAVGSIAEVRTGNSPSRAIPENFGDAIEWVKSDNLAGGFVERASEGLSARGKSVARIAPAGSVLVTCIAGSAASIGRAAVADREVAFNQQINAVLPSGDIHPYFLLTQFKVAPDLVRAKSTGGMKGMVSKSAFQAIEILLPPLGDQREFAKRMEWVFALRARVEGLVRLDDELFASLQSRAFKGEL